MYHCGLPHTENCNDLMEWEYQEKTLTMDYASLDSREAAYLRAKIHNDYQWGNGAYFMVPQFQRLCSAVLGSAAGGCDDGAGSDAGKLLASLVVAGISRVCGGPDGAFRPELEPCFRGDRSAADEYDKKSARSDWLIDNLTYKEGKDIRIYRAKPLVMGALRETERDHMVTAKAGCRAAPELWTESFRSADGRILCIYRAAGAAGCALAGSVVLFASSIYQLCESLKLLARSRSEIFRNARRMESSLDYLELPGLLQDDHYLRDRRRKRWTLNSVM